VRVSKPFRALTWDPPKPLVACARLDPPHKEAEHDCVLKLASPPAELKLRLRETFSTKSAALREVQIYRNNA